MRKTLLLLLLIPASLWAQRLDITSPVRFLALGDSYTIGESVPRSQNWPNQLRDSIAVRNIPTDTLRIIATTGWRTDNLLGAIQNQNLDSVHYNLVSVLIGVNNQFQGRPLSQYLTELPQLLDSAIRYAGGDTSHVFMVSIPDYAYTPYGQSTSSPATISMQLDTYNLAARRYADSLHIRCFDITPISRQGLSDPSLVAGDGLHPSGKQYTRWVQLMLQTIDSAVAPPTAIANLSDANNIHVYPNPVRDKLFISSDAGHASIQILNSIGQEVLAMPFDHSIAIDCATLPKGIYTVRVSDAEHESLAKIVRE